MLWSKPIDIIFFRYFFIKIIPRVYKISENVNSTDKLVSGNAKILSSESNEPVLNVTGFVGIYAKVLNFLLPFTGCSYFLLP